MTEIEVIDDPQVASVALDPIKSRILSELATPGSAASLAGRVGLSRQKVNYHLNVLEKNGLVEPVEKRQWGGLTERLLVASATSYVVSPAALGPIASDPERSNDRLSASYLIALAARMVQEVSDLWSRSRSANKRLASLSLDTVISFKSPADRAAFTHDLTSAITSLVARYNDDTRGSRPHRLIIASYPTNKTQRS